MKKPKRFRVDIPIEERHKQLLEMSDAEIDYSDIPEIDPAILLKAAAEKKSKRLSEQSSIR
jgi:hypothetical protein